MAKLTWGKDVGVKDFELGVDHGVLFVMAAGAYGDGVAWNGLVGVTESPAGAEPTKVYADNKIYAVLMSPETFGLTIEHISAPSAFYPCDGVKDPTTTNGVIITGQPRATFGFAYRTKIGDETSAEKGYKLHLVYGCVSGVAEKAYKTIGDSPEVITFSRTITTTPVVMDDDTTVTAEIVLDSRTIGATAMAAIELLLYGDTGTEASLPTPDEVIAICEPIVAVVAPATGATIKGGTQQYTCKVTGNTTPVPCTWSVTGNTTKTAATVIDSNGMLVVGAAETATTLTILATPIDTLIAPVSATRTVTS